MTVAIGVGRAESPAGSVSPSSAAGEGGSVAVALVVGAVAGNSVGLDTGGSTGGSVVLGVAPY